MTPRNCVRLVWAVCASAFAVAAGCHRIGAAAASSEIAVDSVQGVVSVVGTSFEQRVVVRMAGGEIALLAKRADSAALVRLAGVETRVRGQMPDPKSIRVVSFLAVRVAGVGVIDGVLGKDNKGMFLDTADGPRRIENPPLAFDQLVAARIWVGGNLGSGPYNYGVIVTVPR